MKVLYIGYSKTGTKTMGAVFRELGYKTYDYEENMVYLNQEWTKILNYGSTKEDWLKMYSDVDAVVDAPAYGFWEEILEAFPDVKLLVNYRDEESWCKSVTHQLSEISKDYGIQILSMLSPTARRFLTISQLNCYRLWSGDRGSWPWQMYRDINPTLMKSTYRKHNVYIQSKTPSLNLHVVNLKDGWKPICKFLGEPTPDIPFPHANKGGGVFKEYMDTSPIFAKMKREAMIVVSLLLCIFSIFVYSL